MVMHLLACAWCLVATMMNRWREDTNLNLEEQVLLCRQGSCVSPLFNGTAGESACTGCAKVSAGGDAMTEATDAEAQKQREIKVVVRSVCVSTVFTCLGGLSGIEALFGLVLKDGCAQVKSSQVKSS